MGVQTTADEKLYSAGGHIRDAIKDLSDIVLNECHGHDGFSDAYQTVIYEVMQELIGIRKKLNR